MSLFQRSRRVIGSLALATPMLCPLPAAFAHHAAAGLYDRDRSITVTGRVESLFWRNPHVRFEILVIADDGTETLWQIEAGSVNSLERMGVGEEVLEPGGIVEVTGLPGRADQPIAFARSIVSAEGEAVSIFFQIDALDEHYELERDPSAATDEAIDLFRVWTPVRVPNTGSGRYDFPLTEAARAVRATWDPANDPALSCVPPGMPAAMDNPYPVELIDGGDTITFRLEEWDGVRTIHMHPDTASAARAAAASTAAPSPMGYSVGYWRDDQLIVETSRIDYPNFDDLGTPQSEQIRLTETFDLDADNGRLHWTGEIVDPETFTAPVVLEIEWQWIPGNEIKTFDCALPD